MNSTADLMTAQVIRIFKPTFPIDNTLDNSLIPLGNPPFCDISIIQINLLVPLTVSNLNPTALSFSHTLSATSASALSVIARSLAAYRLAEIQI